MTWFGGVPWTIPLPCLIATDCMKAVPYKRHRGVTVSRGVVASTVLA